MIRALLPRLGVIALLCSAASVAFAQDAQKQRSRTERPQQTPHATTPAQQKPNAASSQQKAGTNSAPGKPAAQAKPGSAGKPGAPAGAPGGGQATLLASFGDWGAYATGQGKTKLCYALSQPKDRLPKDLKRDPAFLFVSFRPADNVRNEVAVVMGFATRDNGSAEVAIGTATYALITKNGSAWIKNQAEETQVVANMSRGRDMTVKATSGRGNATTDRYSLSGFAQALDRARKECS